MQEKYILLNNNFDFKEFDRTKVSLMHQSQKSKFYQKCIKELFKTNCLTYSYVKICTLKINS